MWAMGRTEIFFKKYLTVGTGNVSFWRKNNNDWNRSHWEEIIEWLFWFKVKNIKIKRTKLQSLNERMFLKYKKCASLESEWLTNENEESMTLTRSEDYSNSLGGDGETPHFDKEDETIFSTPPKYVCLEEFQPVSLQRAERNRDEIPPKYCKRRRKGSRILLSMPGVRTYMDLCIAAHRLTTSAWKTSRLIQYNERNRTGHTSEVS